MFLMVQMYTEWTLHFQQRKQQQLTQLELLRQSAKQQTLLYSQYEVYCTK